MIALRTRLSLGQFLERFEPHVATTLLSKHSGAEVFLPRGPMFAQELVAAIRSLDGHAVISLLSEVVATQSELRQRLTPRCVFDERFRDLVQCLRLDGYEVTQARALVRLVTNARVTLQPMARDVRMTSCRQDRAFFPTT